MSNKQTDKVLLEPIASVHMGGLYGSVSARQALESIKDEVLTSALLEALKAVLSKEMERFPDRIPTSYSATLSVEYNSLEFGKHQ